jgi:exodeoxyribonuclease V alpha subunit
MHRGPAGAGALNTLLQDALTPARPDRAEKRFGGRVFRVGDKVTQIRNNYDKGASGRGFAKSVLGVLTCRGACWSGGVDGVGGGGAGPGVAAL